MCSAYRLIWGEASAAILLRFAFQVVTQFVVHIGIHFVTAKERT
jgi:hypothetical protein